MRPWDGAATCGEQLVVKQVLKGGPRGMEPCWSSDWSAAAMGNPCGIRLGRTASMGGTPYGVGAESEHEGGADTGIMN